MTETDRKELEYIRNNHIKELQRRGLEPTQENIDNLVLELHEIIAKSDKEQLNKQTREQENKTALLYVVDEIGRIKNNLEKACVLSNEINDNYFLRFNWEDEKDVLGMRVDFPKNAIYAGIIDDYLNKAYSVLDELEERANSIRSI